MQKVDLILKAAYVVTMDSKDRILESAAVVVKDGVILDVDTIDKIQEKYHAEKVLGGQTYALLPSFVNAHTHSPMVYFRGLADDLPLNVWLQEHIWPSEAKFVAPEFIRDATELACLEMIRAGISIFNDMYFYVDVTAEVVKRAGLRAVLGTGILEFPTPEAKNVDECFEKAEAFIQKYQNDPLVVPAVAPHAPYTCSAETYERAFELAEKYSTAVHTHLAETKWEVEEIQKRYSRRPVEYLHELGFLRPNLIAAHCVWVTDKEIELIADTSTKVVHCPESNLKLASGFSPVTKMLSAGVTVSLGTDGAASNNNLDIMEEMSTAAKIHKALSEDPTVVDAKTALKMATVYGVEVLGLSSQLGSLEPGKQADIVLIELNEPHLVPIYNIYSHLVYSAKSSDISCLVVNGKVLMEQKKVLSFDEEEVLKKAKKWAEKIIQ